VANPFNNILLLKKFCTTSKFKISTSCGVSFVGEGPYTQQDFAEFITADNEQYTAKWDQIYHTKNESALNHKVQIIILGNDADKDEMIARIRSFRGKRVYACSQEMYISWFYLGVDPFQQGHDVLLEFARDHEPLMALYVGIGDSGFDFDWPSAMVPDSGQSIDEIEVVGWPAVGLLKHMGYSVGKSSTLSDRGRRMILRDVFTSENLPQVNSLQYMAEWGASGSSGERLEKLANSLASFSRAQKRKNDPSYISIGRWDSDLEWLNKTFYKVGFSFEWPNPDVE